MSKRNTSRMIYKKNWRQVEKRRKRCNSFVVDYIYTKFTNVYNEAICFHRSLEQLYPDKDLRRTIEYKQWKKQILSSEDKEENIITQTLNIRTVYEQENDPIEAAQSDTKSQADEVD